MKIYPLLVLAVALATSCATLNESVQLGAGIGGATGMAAIYAGHAGTDRGATFKDAAISAGIGTVLGVITSYFVHGSVEERRASLQSDQTEMHFGDLPPSPFIIPKKYPTKKGVR